MANKNSIEMKDLEASKKLNPQNKKDSSKKEIKIEKPHGDKTGFWDLLNTEILRSSLRGIKHTIDSKSRFLRIFWGLGTIALVSISIIHLVSLLLTYLMGHTRVNVSVKSVESIAFPAITVCKTRALTLQDVARLTDQGLHSPWSYRNRIREMMTKSKLNQRQVYFTESLLLNNAAYYENLPEEVKNSLGLDVIQSSRIGKTCFAVYRDSKDGPIKKAPCVVKTVPLVGHFNCFEIRAPFDRFVHKVKFSLILEKHDEIKCSQVIPESEETLKNGVLVKLHGPDEFVLDMKSAKYFPAGSSNRVVISKSRTMKLLREEDKKEAKEAKKFLVYPYNGKERNESYSEGNCQILEAQRYVADRCKCGLNQFFPKIKSCFRQDLKQPSLELGSIDCLENISTTWRFHLQSAGFKSWENCLKDNVLHKYMAAYHQDQLTQEYSKLDFYLLMKRENIIETSESYEKILSLQDSKNPSDLAEAREILRSNTSDIRDQVIRVTVRHKHPMLVKEYDEVLVMDLKLLMSSVGGALAMWAGITVVFIFEIVEFIFVFCKWLKNRHCG